jgi:hypothetical protein
MILTPEEIRVVPIADRESDIFEFMTRAEELEAEYLIRAAQDRCIQGPAGRLWAHLEAQAPQGSLTLNLPARSGQAARHAQVVVRFCPVTLRPPQDQTPTERLWLEPLEGWGVLVQEIAPPTGGTPVEWLLLTNVSVTTWQEALERLHWYCACWGIEVWHKVLKSGCTVEDCRLAGPQHGPQEAARVALGRCEALPAFLAALCRRPDRWPDAPPGPYDPGGGRLTAARATGNHRAGGQDCYRLG